MSHGDDIAYVPPQTIDRVQTSRGELVLRRPGEQFEIISNGVFLMDTSDGTSERLLIDAAVERSPAAAPRLLIGGLGVGFSLERAIGYPRLAAIDVVEIEPTIIRWHEQHLGAITADAIRDPRVSVHEANAIDWLARSPSRYDIVCLDTDNGPNWLVFDANAGLYDASGLDLAHASLRNDGVLAVWSASRDVDFEERVRNRFGNLDVLETPQDRGAPDVVYIAQR